MEHFTKTGAHTYGVPSSLNNLFDGLVELYTHIKDIKIHSIEIQTTGYTNSNVRLYEAISTNLMRILVVVKERGFSCVSVYIDKIPVRIMITTDAVYPLPYCLSNIEIDSGGSLPGRNVKACKCIYFIFDVESLNSNPQIRVGNEFIGVDMKRGNQKDMVKVFQKAKEAGVDIPTLLADLERGSESTEAKS